MKNFFIIDGKGNTVKKKTYENAEGKFLGEYVAHVNNTSQDGDFYIAMHLDKDDHVIGYSSCKFLNEYSESIIEKLVVTDFDSYEELMERTDAIV